MITFKLFSCFAILGMVACGSARDETSIPATSFAELSATSLEIAGKLEDAEVTPVENLPDTGSITYAGALTLLLQDGSDDGVIGAAEVNADFGTNVVTGGADNFYDLSGNPTAGSVTIDDGMILAGTGIVTGEVNGNVEFGIGALDVTTDIAGAFVGDDAELFTGVLSGDATPTGGTAIAVQGAIIAEE